MMGVLVSRSFEGLGTFASAGALHSGLHHLAFKNQGTLRDRSEIWKFYGDSGDPAI